jgi:3-(3-hydroxy-phenyl)propionate hydroxylase
MANVEGIPVWRDIGSTPVADWHSSNTAATVIVGGGPIGLAMALDLGLRGHNVLLLNKLDFIAGGSKAICFAKRSLDIFERLGVGDAVVKKGVIWNVGKVFWGAADEPIFQFDMLPVKNQKNPGFVNIQQYYVEEQLLDALSALPNVELRWGHEVTGVVPKTDSVSITVKAADRTYAIDTEWLIACDGSRSTIRDQLGLDFDGRIFEDNFLIADVRMVQDRPAERWFWFDPPFNPGQSALMHKQPDNIWRLDFQLGWNIDREACVKPENVEPYVRAMLGDDVEFTQEWYSVYTFQCRRMAQFVHGRIIFAGDSAQLVSPFGARGCNGGLAEIDNLGWKLDLILRGNAPASLIDSYNDEAVTTADENILNSTRSTDFMTPKTPASKAMRDAVLELAQDHAFAQPFVNSGRLSTAVSYPNSSLNTPDVDVWHGGVPPGSPALDAPIGSEWLLSLTGGGFVLLVDGWHKPMIAGVEILDISTLSGDLSLLRSRYAMHTGTAYLIRPDQYIAARWRNPKPDNIEMALAQTMGRLLCHA